jgi:hypothetical protein
MTNKDLIKQYVDTGILIPEYQLNQLNNNLRTTYLRKRGMTGKLVDYEIIMLPYDDRTKYINNLDSDGIKSLLWDSKEPGKFINILGNKGIEFINNLNSSEIDGLLMYSKEPDKFINILGNKGIEYINNLSRMRINILLGFSKEKDKISEIIRKYRPDIELNENKIKLSNLI